jgi:hypothetical protein
MCEVKESLGHEKDLGHERVQITEETKVTETWYKEAKQQNFGTLYKFLSNLCYKYEHDYGTIIHAMAAGAIATATAMNRTPAGGITRFQADGVMWQFIRGWSYGNNVTGLKLIDYDKMLFPQYRESFEKTISQETFQRLQKRASELMGEREEGKGASIEVLEHWRRIIEGEVPFGYSLTDSEE